MDIPTHCTVCNTAVNFASRPVAVAHYRSKKHRANVYNAGGAYVMSQDERDIGLLTHEEALAITQPRNDPITIPMQLVATGPDGKTYRVYSDVVGKVVGK